MYNKYIISYIYVCALFYNIIQHTLISHHQITSSRWEMAAAVDNWMIWSLGIHGLGVKKILRDQLDFWNIFLHVLTTVSQFKKTNTVTLCYTVTQAKRLWTSFVFMFCFSLLWIKDSTRFNVEARFASQKHNAETSLGSSVPGPGPKEPNRVCRLLMAWRRGSK